MSRRITGDFVPVQALGGHQHLGISPAQALVDGFRAEGREQWAKDAAVFQRAERGDIERGDTPGQDERPLTLVHAQLSQHIGKAVALLLQIAIGEIAHGPVSAQPAQGQVAASRTIGVAVDRFIGDVQPLPSGRPSSSRRTVSHEKVARVWS
jgi:hypothetical protein